MNEQELLEIVRGYQSSALIMALVELDICGFLNVYPEGATLPEIASGLGLEARPLERVLGAAVALGLLAASQGCYSNTPLSRQYLAKAGSHYLGKQIKSYAEQYQGWGKLSQLLMDGEPVLPSLQAEAGDEKALRNIILGLDSAGRKITPQLLPLLGPYLKKSKRLLDVGCGAATYALAFAEKYPDLDVTLLDRPAVLEIARELASQSAAQERLHFLPADYRYLEFGVNCFEVILFFQVLRTESPGTILSLLQKAALALTPDGIIVIYDSFLEEGKSAPLENVMQNLTMAMMYQEGGLFSVSELSGWLEKSGFEAPLCHSLRSTRPMLLAIAWIQK